MKLIEWARTHKFVVLLCICGAALLITTAAALALTQRKDIKMQHIAADELVDDSMTGNKITNYRLPRWVKPNNYNLTLEPDLVKKTFIGTVAITLDVLLSTKEIILHSKYLNVSSISLTNQNKSKVLKISHGLSKDGRDFMYIKSNSKMNAGHSIVLVINYTGSLDRGLVGFYKTTLKNGKNGRYELSLSSLISSKRNRCNTLTY